MIKVGDKVKMTIFHSERYSSEWINSFKDRSAIVISIKPCTRWKSAGIEEQIIIDGKPLNELTVSFEDCNVKYIMSNIGLEIQRGL